MSVLTLYPYAFNVKDGGVNSTLWVFDDKEKQLKEEAFILGVSEIISALVENKRIPKAKKGFKLSFSDKPFNHDIELKWFANQRLTNGLGGNWYYTDFNGQTMTGWLCPALLHYFKTAPDKLYGKAEPLPTGVDPIWHEAESYFAYVPGIKANC